MEERLLGLFRRSPGRYAALVAVVLAALATAAIALMEVLFQRWMQFPGHVIRTHALAVALAVLAAGAAWQRRHARAHRPFWTWWLRREIAGPVDEVRRDAFAFPGAAARGLTASAAVAGFLAAGAVMAHYDRLSWSIGLILVEGTLFAAAFSAAMIRLTLSVALRPALIDLPESQPAVTRGEPADRVGWRVFITTLAITWFGGVAVGGFIGSPASGADEVHVVFAVSFAVALTFGAVVSTLLTLTIVEPVRDLVRATERVGAGDLATEVPVLASDEHGRLAVRFNEMIAGLRERQALHAAVGAYIDPAIAERVAVHGADIAGEAAEVTVMFVDIVAFTTSLRGRDARAGGDRSQPVLRPRDPGDRAAPGPRQQAARRRADGGVRGARTAIRPR